MTGPASEDGRRSGKSKLVYNKATRTIDTVTTTSTVEPSADDKARIAASLRVAADWWDEPFTKDGKASPLGHSALLREAAAALSASREGDGGLETEAADLTRRAHVLLTNTIRARLFKGEFYDSGADEYLSQLHHVLKEIIELVPRLSRSPDGWRAIDGSMDVLEAMSATLRLWRDSPNERRPPQDPSLSIQHCVDMWQRAKHGKHSYGKNCRWLAWIQASAVAANGATLDEMKAINKRCQLPEPPVKNEESK